MIIHGKLLREERLKKGWTQEQLAIISDVSIRTVQRAEREGLTSIESINAFCVGLNIELADLREAEELSPEHEAQLTNMRTISKISIAFFIGVVFSYLVFLIFE